MDMPKTIRELRTKAWLSQKELAKRSGVHRVTIMRLELGREKPHGSTLRKLAEALGVDPVIITGPWRGYP
jgi:transcriptional regulator with XRE-family HTH domain